MVRTTALVRLPMLVQFHQPDPPTCHDFGVVRCNVGAELVRLRGSGF